MAEHIFAGVHNILTAGHPSGNDMLLIQKPQEDAIDRFLEEFEDLRDFKILDPDGREFFQYGEMGIDMSSRNFLLQEAVQTRKKSSHLWAYKDLNDRKGIPISSTGVMDTRNLSYEYFIPVLERNEVRAVLYASFYVKRLPRLIKLITLGNITLVFIFLLSIFIGLSIWCDNAIKRPLEFILQAQDKLAKGDFDTRVDLDVVQTNELARAYGSFNRMAEDLKSSRGELEKKNLRLRELNEQYRELNERLEQEVQKKTKELREFFSLITHDLKVPLAASQGYTDLLLKSKTGPLNDKQKKFLQSISMANSHLLHLVRNMLDSVKYDAGKINYYMEGFDLSVLVEEVKSNLHLFLEERGITLEISIPPECERVYADRMRIGQVITNLLGNAIEISPQGEKITLTAQPYHELVEIEIRDRGPGMPQEVQSTIFDKFTQFHKDVKSSGGMGLGLYIVRRILEGHSQNVRVVSHQGNGSTFIFTLPQEKEKELNQTGQHQESPQ
jgi:two-component system phosphate regulon sensor histidine kinase PhoR